MKSKVTKILAVTLVFSALFAVGVYTHGSLGIDPGGVTSYF